MKCAGWINEKAPKMNGEMAAREMTCEEWAARLVSGLPHNPKPAEMLAIALKAAESRAEMRERRACADLAREHAHTITEETVQSLRVGKDLDEAERIELASTMRHVAQYVGALISQRTPPPPHPFKPEPR